jgi:hypothetical protein
MVRFPLQCKDELHCSWRSTRATKASHDFGNIVKGEVGSVINLDNISTLETSLEVFQGPMLCTSTTTKDPGDISPMKMRASVKLETKGSIICEVKQHQDGMHTNKCARRHIKSRQGNIKLHHVWVLGPDAIEETGIGRLLEKVIHAFIKPNMLSFLDSFTLNIIVNDLLHGLGEAKEDTDTSIGDKVGIAKGTIRNGINMAAEGMEVPKVRTVA